MTPKLDNLSITPTTFSNYNDSPLSPLLIEFGIEEIKEEDESIGSSVDLS